MATKKQKPLKPQEPEPELEIGGMKVVRAHIRGTQPQLQHNVATASPLHPLRPEIARTIEALKSKNLDDAKRRQLVERKLRLQALGSLYLDEDSRPCWPGENVEAMLCRAAVLKQRGLQGRVKAGVRCQGTWSIIYRGPKDPEALVKDPRFRFDVMVNGNPTAGRGGGRVLSGRPIFRSWELKFELIVAEDGKNLTAAGVVDLLTRAGMFVGLSDWRERFGRFEVVSAQIAGA